MILKKLETRERKRDEKYVRKVKEREREEYFNKLD